MTQVELATLIGGAEWFRRCGTFVGEFGAVPLKEIAKCDDWDWLPTSRDQTDPVHGEALCVGAEANGLGQVRREAERAALTQLLAALQQVPESVAILVDGPHDFTSAARGGAQFAARMAAREIVMGRPEFWCRVIRLFAAGYWPCGLTRDGERLIVF